jgi:hypothetical protein
VLLGIAQALSTFQQGKMAREQEQAALLPKPKHPLDEAKILQELQLGGVDLEQKGFDLRKSGTEFEQGLEDRDVAEEARLRQGAFDEVEPDVRAAVEPALLARRTGEVSPESDALISKMLARYPEMQDQILGGAKTESEIAENEAQAVRALRPPQSAATSSSEPKKVGVSTDGQVVFRASGGMQLADGTPYSGRVFATSPSAAERKDSGALETMLSDVQFIANIIDLDLESGEGGGKLSSGPISGRFSRLMQSTTGVGQDTGFTITLSENLADQLLRARSGAQINEQEYERLRRLLPNVNDPESTFIQKLRLYYRELRNIQAVRGKVSRGGGTTQDIRSGAEGVEGGEFIIEEVQ